MVYYRIIVCVVLSEHDAQCVSEWPSVGICADGRERSSRSGRTTVDAGTAGPRTPRTPKSSVIFGLLVHPFCIQYGVCMGRVVSLCAHFLFRSARSCFVITLRLMKRSESGSLKSWRDFLGQPSGSFLLCAQPFNFPALSAKFHSRGNFALIIFKLSFN